MQNVSKYVSYQVKIGLRRSDIRMQKVDFKSKI